MKAAPADKRAELIPVYHGFTATAESGSTLFVDLAGERVAVRCVGAHAPQSPPALLTMDETSDLITALTGARAALGA